MRADGELFARQFGKYVRRRRREKGYSQADLGELCSIHRSAIHMIESGQRIPRLDTAVKIMTVLAGPTDGVLRDLPVWVPSKDGDGEWVAGLRRSRH